MTLEREAKLIKTWNLKKGPFTPHLTPLFPPASAMFLKKAKDAAKEDQAKQKIERARKAREEARAEASRPPVESEAQKALRQVC